MSFLQFLHEDLQAAAVGLYAGLPNQVSAYSSRVLVLRKKNSCSSDMNTNGRGF